MDLSPQIWLFLKKLEYHFIPFEYISSLLKKFNSLSDGVAIDNETEDYNSGDIPEEELVMVFDEERGELYHSGKDKELASVDEDSLSFNLSELEEVGESKGKKGKDWIMDI